MTDVSVSTPTSVPSGIEAWLSALGMSQYAAAFEANDIDMGLMPEIGEQALKDIGVSSVGHRVRLLKAIAGLRAASASIPASAPAGAPTLRYLTGELEGERRQLTVLFCDMVGFTELASRVDPELLRQVIRTYEDACAVCITRYDGYVFQRLGDGIVAFFGYPLAHEGEAERAIHAGLAIIESLAGLEVAEVDRLSVRIGIATGVVVVSSVEKNAVGERENEGGAPAKPGVYIMRNAKGETSTNLSVGIFSPSSIISSNTFTSDVSPKASFARSAWLFCAERATEKNRSIGMVSSGPPNNLQRRGRYPTIAHALPCQTSRSQEYAQATR